MDSFYEISLIIVFLVFCHIFIYLWISKKNPKSIENKHVVVTGGSSGIGLCIATQCAKLGANVTIIARDPKKLQKALDEVKKNSINDRQKIQFLSLDLSKNYSNIEKSLKQLEDDVGPIYALINSAGGAICGRIDETSVEDAEYMMNINYFATFYPTRYVLTKLKKAGEGIITITGSQASLMGIYGLGAYAAAKFALRGLAETIAMETSNTNISITLALPADTDTPGFENENLTKPEETKTISGGGGLAKPDDVAAKILNDSLSGNFISIFGAESWLITLMCTGVSPWGGFMFTVFQSLISGPLRFVAYGIQWHCRNVVKTTAKKRSLNAKKSE